MDELSTPGERCTLAVESNGSASVTIAVTGEVDLSTVRILQDAVDQVLEEEPDVLVFDLSQTTFMDSSGLAALITAANRCRGVRIRRPSQPVSRLLEVTGLTTILPSEP